MNEKALQDVLSDMKHFRPDLTEQQIRWIIEDWEKYKIYPTSEAAQDVIFCYKLSTVK